MLLMSGVEVSARSTEADAAVAGADSEPPRSADRGFRPDIEGLRGVAVLVVVLFHAGMPGIGGGFAGVDVFFVISGFLITGMLWREFADTGTIALARFYGGRARRLLPTAGVVLLVVAVASVTLLSPLRAREALRDAVASALYTGNLRFAARGADYLAADLPPSPFQHYWSLGVEEQFYLLWPALIIGAAWLARRVGRAGRGSALPHLLVLALVAALSFAVALDWTRTRPPWAFFCLPSRAWELAAGGLVALTAPLWRRLPISPARVVGWVGLGLIGLACACLDAKTRYPGTAALLPVAGAALVIAAGCGSVSGGAGRALSRSAIRALGRVSYPWYLWHWPVLLLAPRLLGRPLGLAGGIGAVAMSLGLAMLTLVLVEDPVRFAAGLRHSPARSLAMGAGVTAAVVATATALLALTPEPVGRGPAVRALRLDIPAVAAPLDPRLTVIGELIGQVNVAVAESAGSHAVPSNLSPALAEAAGDKAAVFVNGCLRSWLQLGEPECASGDADSATGVALVGDSHAAMWNPALAQAAARWHWRLETMAKVTCPPMDLPITSPYLGREYTECVAWRQQIMARLRAEHPRLVVVGISRRYGGDFGFRSYDRAWLESLRSLVVTLRGMGAEVLVLGPVPDPHLNPPTCLSDHLDDAAACSSPRSAAVNAAGIAAEQAATAAGGGQYADLTPLFCTDTRCPVVVGNDLVYRDDNHLTVSYARTLAPVLSALADHALAAPHGAR
jgi:peptidoglycan/LPS O-acetylase OafA/YrhL